MSLDAPPLAATNPKIKQLRRLIGRRSARREAGCFVLDGPLLVGEAVALGAPVEAIYIDEELAPTSFPWAGEVDDARWVRVRAGVLTRILDPATPRPIAAVVAHRPPSLRTVASLDAVAGLAPVVVLAGLADPGNVGTIVRSAAATGAAAVVVTPGTADPFGPKAVRASAGAALRLPVVEEPLDTTLDQLAALGYEVWLADAAEGDDPAVMPADQPVALVIGNESHGLPAVGTAGARRVRIPLDDRTESLNAAMATTVILFDLARRRA